MRNRTLLILGLVFLVLGLTPGMPIPIFLMVHLAHAGGALIVLAALRFLFAPVAGPGDRRAPLRGGRHRHRARRRP